MVNVTILVGRVGNEPEVKYFQSGQANARFSLATNKSWTDKDGQKKEKTEWHNIVVWGQLAEIVGKHLHKGRQVYAEGELTYRSYEDSQGQKKWVTEVVCHTVQFLGSFGGDNTTLDSDVPL